MICVAIFFAVLLIINCVIYCKNIADSHRFIGAIDNKHAQNNTPNINKLALLIPMYREEKIAKDTVKYFNKISSKYSLDVFYITSAQEGAPNFNTTHKIIVDCINNRPRVIHNENKDGAKAGQVNLALKILSKENIYDYFGIFDADSRPDPKAFEYIQKTAFNSDILQMPSIYTENTSGLSWINKASAIFQTRWTLCYEIPMWRKWEQSSANKNPLMYLVGHGLFLHAKSNLKLPESTITEDLKFGYTCAVDGKSLSVVPFCDRCTVPSRYTSNIYQASRWFYGEVALAKVLVERIRSIKHKPYLMMQFIKRYLQISEWLFGPILFAAIISIALINFDTILTTLLFIGFILYLYVIPKMTNVLFGLGAKLYPYYTARSLLNFLGPLLCIARMILGVLGIRRMTFNKTDR